MPVNLEILRATLNGLNFFANYRTINAGVLSAKPFDFPKKFVDQGGKQGAQ
jgi:hypothetical protein